MRIRLLFLLMCLVLACAPGLESVSGVYDMVRHQGKPIPFMGVRGGRVTLSEDGAFIAVTELAELPGSPESVVDTVPGTYGFDTWEGGCLYLRVDFRAEDIEDPDPFGQICGDTLYMSFVDGLFMRVGDRRDPGSERQ